MPEEKKPQPIKLILLREGDLKKSPPGGGNDPKLFIPEEKLASHRRLMAQQTRQVSEEFVHHFRSQDREIPAVACVTMNDKAIAKSHRPLTLFNKDTCPIIAGGSLGELYVAVTEPGLANLRSRILTIDTPKGQANVSALGSMAPYRLHDSVSIPEDATDALVRVFDYRDSRTNDLVHERVEELAEELGLRFEWVTIGSSYEILRIPVRDMPERVKELADFVGIRHLTTERAIRLLSHVQRPVKRPGVDVPKPSPNVEYPIVGLIDSGIPNNHPLSPWVQARERFVAPSEVNHDHGTFVAGLLVFGDSLDVPGSPDATRAVKVVDVCAVPNDDDSKGPVGVLTPTEAAQIIETAVRKYRRQGVRVWNVSFNDDALCRDDSFSDFAMALDVIQEEYDVVVVVSTGNYVTAPYRSWPPATTLGDQDRLMAPAESVRSLSVGSISRITRPGALSPVNSPSPFSRRGPGPAFLLKPELVEYGGNCNAKGDFVGLGEVSFSQSGVLVEDVGTSFATPKIANLMARIAHAYEGDISTNLLKALTVHSARHPSHHGFSNPDEIRYVGFGRPSDLPQILVCSEHSGTFVIEGVVYPQYEIDVLDFPYPPPLIRNGRCYGEISATLVYDPPLDPRGGGTYVRTNLSLSMGTYEMVTDERGRMKPEYTRQVLPQPDFGHGRYERELVENGWKWAPIKTYYRKLTKGVANAPWRLKVEMLQRDELVVPEEQRFAVVISITAAPGTNVYGPMIRELRRTFVLQDLPLRQRIRTRLHLST